MDRAPRVRRVTFRPSPPHILHHVPDDIGLWTPTLPRPRGTASHAIRVPRVGSLPPAAFRSHLAMGTLAVRLGVPVIKVSKGLAPSSHFPVGFRLPVASAVMALRAMPGAHWVGRDLTVSPFPHHRTFGSRMRRFGRFSMLAHAQALAGRAGGRTVVGSLRHRLARQNHRVSPG